MPMCARLLPLFLLAFTLLTTARAYAEGESQADLLARLDAAHDAGDLTDPALKPWHMLATFDLVDPKGHTTEHGTFEEWWAAPDKWHQRIVSPSFNQDLYRAGDQSFSASPGRLPYFLGILSQQLRSPIPALPAESASSMALALERKNFGPVQLDCILLQSAKMQTPLSFGRSPTYCLTSQRPQLRFFMESGVQHIVRNRLALFQGKSVALDIAIEEGEYPALRAKLDQLQGGSVAEADLTPPANLPRTTLTPQIAGFVLSGRKLSGSQPVYPVEAKSQHISGTVLLQAIVGRDGGIESIATIWSPHPSLSKAAIEAVRTWTYQPYLLNGEPTEVETTITINFNITVSP